jgi:hypothetical protein
MRSAAGMSRCRQDKGWHCCGCRWLWRWPRGVRGRDTWRNFRGDVFRGQRCRQLLAERLTMLEVIIELVEDTAGRSLCTVLGRENSAFWPLNCSKRFPSTPVPPFIPATPGMTFIAAWSSRLCATSIALIVCSSTIDKIRLRMLFICTEASLVVDTRYLGD